MSRRQLIVAYGQSGGGYVPPTYMTIDSSVKVTIDANSIWSDQMGIPGIEDLSPLVDFMATTGCTMNNVSIAGQQWSAMASNHSDVDASWDPSKNNILMCGETRNTVFNGHTYDQTLAQIADYVDAVLSVHPWKIVMMGCLPSDGIPTAADENVIMKNVDGYVSGHLNEFSAVNFCNYRDLSPFYGDGASRQGFMTTIQTCLEDFPGPYVHPDGHARDLIAFRMGQALSTIPA